MEAPTLSCPTRHTHISYWNPNVNTYIKLEIIFHESMYRLPVKLSKSWTCVNGWVKNAMIDLNDNGGLREGLAEESTEEQREREVNGLQLRIQRRQKGHYRSAAKGRVIMDGWDGKRWLRETQSRWMWGWLWRLRYFGSSLRLYVGTGSAICLRITSLASCIFQIHPRSMLATCFLYSTWHHIHRLSYPPGSTHLILKLIWLIN